MHAHDFEPGLAASTHVSVSREVAEADPAMLEAAVGGRSDKLNTGALLNLQRLAGNSSVSSMLAEEEPSPVRQVVGSGGGSPLESSTRTLLESRLGHDFTDVRIHTGAQADASAKSINAQAYTVGNDVVFQTGKYAPDTPVGMHTLAHELTHVVQQRSGPVDGTPAAGGIRLSDPSDPFEQAAERSAATAMAPSVEPAAPAAGTSVQTLPSNFKEGEEEETAQTLVAQTLVAQREETDEKEED